MSQYADNLSDLELALKSLQPATPEVQRDELMYQAGWAAAEANSLAKSSLRNRRSLSVWRAATCVSAAAALLLAFREDPSPVVQPTPPPQSAATTMVVAAPQAQEPAEHESVNPSVSQPRFVAADSPSYLTLRRAALANRFASYWSLPADGRGHDVPSPPTQPVTARGLMRELLDEEPTRSSNPRGAGSARQTESNLQETVA